MVSNQEFLRAIFGAMADVAHVTDFRHDPSNIPPEQHLIAWKGDYFSRYSFQPPSNQYFTISTFDPDERGVARRRKALFKATHCIVLDDVREKLSIEAAKRLPSLAGFWRPHRGVSSGATSWRNHAQTGAGWRTCWMD